MIQSSQIAQSSSIDFLHYNIDEHEFVTREVPLMDRFFVQRAPPLDMRSDGKPVSIIIDFVK